MVPSDKQKLKESRNPCNPPAPNSFKAWQEPGSSWGGEGGQGRGEVEVEVEVEDRRKRPKQIHHSVQTEGNRLDNLPF